MILTPIDQDRLPAALGRFADTLDGGARAIFEMIAQPAAARMHCGMYWSCGQISGSFPYRYEMKHKPGRLMGWPSWHSSVTLRTMEYWSMRPPSRDPRAHFSFSSSAFVDKVPNIYRKLLLIVQTSKSTSLAACD